MSLIAAITVLVGTVASPGAPAVAAPVDRVETVIENSDGLQVSHVRLHDPMLPAAAPHDAACDEQSYVRYRWADGPADPQQSDGVLVGSPGFALGGFAMDRLARNTLTMLAERGQRMEWWTPVPRSVCVFDMTGLDAAYRAKDYRVAADYYWGGKPVDGKTFAGFPADAELGVLADMGAAQFVTDLQHILVRELPDQDFRHTKTFCGGHSDGGLWFGMFAAWDFGGGERNAGFNQCAGFFAVGSLIDADWANLKDNPVTATASDAATAGPYQAAVAAVKAGVIPRSASNTPIIDPQWWVLQAVAGNAAYFRPDEETKLNKLIPKVPVLADTARFLFARSHADFHSGANGVDAYRFTNEAFLGAISGDTSINFTDFAVSFGALCGGPVEAKQFPWPDQAAELPGAGFYLGAVTGGTTRVGPTDPDRLYRWCGYDELDGLDYADPAQAVVDLRDYARQLAMPTPGFTNPYIPFGRFDNVDLPFILAGARSGDLAPMRYDTKAKTRPILTVFGTDDTEERLGRPLMPADTVYAHGYTHWDPPFGAAVQNNGSPEVVSDNLARFVARYLR